MAQNYGYRSYFVPKECLDFGVDKPGFDIPLVKYSNNSNVVGSKYIYVSDNKIEGSESNGTSPNSGWVFRYAIVECSISIHLPVFQSDSGIGFLHCKEASKLFPYQSF